MMENWLLGNEIVVFPIGKHQFIILKHFGCNNLFEIMVVYYLKTEEALKKSIVGLPHWLSGKESTCQCRRHRFNSWPRKIPPATELQLLSLCSKVWELQLLMPEYSRACALQQEKPEHCDKV